MTDNPVAGYFRNSLGSITGFDQANLPSTNPNLAQVGWSVEQLRAYLENQSDVNFPSADWIQRVEQMILDHQTNTDNPHQTTLAQIAGDIIAQVLGGVTPGTVPSTTPFYAFDATAGLPLGTIFPATYDSQNIYRRTEGGWFVNVDDELEKPGSDTTVGDVGIPLFSTMTSITPPNWHVQAGVSLNTTIADATDTSLNYPFVFKAISETPVVKQFGIDIPMVQNLQVNYSTCFLITPAVAGGLVRIFQPSDTTNYLEVNLEDGSVLFYSDTMIGTTVRYPDGVIRVAVGFTSSSVVTDNKLRLVHLDPNQTGDGTRQGSLGREVFSIAHPQTTTASIDQPFVADLLNQGSCPTFTSDLTTVGAPATMDRFIITMGLTLRPMLPLMPIQDPTILTFGNLVISRDQTKITVSSNGSLVFTTDLLEGENKISLSYSPTELIFKDLLNDRQSVTGVFAPLPTDEVTFGPCGGYLQYFALYPQSDEEQVLEFLTNG